MTALARRFGPAGLTVFVALVTFCRGGHAADRPVPVLSHPAPGFLLSQVAFPALVPGLVPQGSPAPVTPPLAFPSRIDAPHRAPDPSAPPDRVLKPDDVDETLSRESEEAGEAEGLEAEAEGDLPEAIGENQIPKGEEDVPDALAERVRSWIRYFQTRGRDRFEVWLSRSGRYGEMMRGILGEYGLPGDLVYLALIESGFSPKAYSVARAAGPWQFIHGTGRKYGLRIDWWADERRDFEKSTRAAASYLKDLYGMFESWDLAAAAYNAGEGKISRAVARYKTDDFAKLIRYRYLKRETRDYVPKMFAALSIAKDPDRYGFGHVEFEEPYRFDRVRVPGGTSLEAMSRIVEVPYETLRELNPELRRVCTPPDVPEYEMRVPAGAGRMAEERHDAIRAEGRVTFLLHEVRRGESLSSLAQRYGTSVPVLQEMNGMRRTSLGRRARVVIPVTGLAEEESLPGKEISHAKLEAAMRRGGEEIPPGATIRIRRGDTLSSIARRSGVSVSELARHNGISPKSRIIAGKTLRIPPLSSSPAPGSRSNSRTAPKARPGASRSES